MTDQNKLSFFLKALQRHDLPGFDAHVELTPYRATVKPPEPGSGARSGAVALVVVWHKPLEPFIVLTKRASYKGVHGGQISFPGGKKEENDTDMLEAAIRETTEETGLVLLRDDFVAELSQIFIPPSNYLVYPYLFFTQREPTYAPNHEVDYMVEFPLAELMNNANFTTIDIALFNGTTLKNAPCFLYKNEIIWGATAAILNELKWIVKKM